MFGQRDVDRHLSGLDERHLEGRHLRESHHVGLRDVYHPRYPAAESRVPDQCRADVFLREFAEFERNGNLPNLVLLLLYDDHTEGTSPGFPTPRAAVADNDLALGRIVEAISRSRYWKESAIFVTEDDSQDGLDQTRRRAGAFTPASRRVLAPGLSGPRQPSGSETLNTDLRRNRHAGVIPSDNSAARLRARSARRTWCSTSSAADRHRP